MNSLSTINLFASLEEDDLMPLEVVTTWRHYEQDEVIVSAGRNDRNDVFFVVKGRVRLAVHGGPVGEITFIDYGVGEFFGELSALDPEAPSITVVALEDCTLGIMSHRTFLRVLFEYRYVAQHVMQHLATCIRLLMKPEGPTAKKSDTQLVFAELLKRSEPSNVDEGIWIVEEMPTEFELANAAGASEDAVSAAVDQLVRVGLARHRDQSLLILDRGRVRQLAGAQ